MRNITFNMPVNLMVLLAKIVDEKDLKNCIEGITDDGDILISIEYPPDQKEVIKEILDVIDTFNDANKVDKNNHEN